MRALGLLLLSAFGCGDPVEANRCAAPGDYFIRYQLLEGDCIDSPVAPEWLDDRFILVLTVDEDSLIQTSCGPVDTCQELDTFCNGIEAQEQIDWSGNREGTSRVVVHDGAGPACDARYSTKVLTFSIEVVE